MQIVGRSYNISYVIITKTSPFTKEEIKKVAEEFETYIKTVIDLDKKSCSAGANRHFESEKIMLEQGSRQKDIWGGGVDLETKAIDANAMINIRPNDNNNSNELLDSGNRKKFEDLTEYFFEVLLK